MEAPAYRDPQAGAGFGPGSLVWELGGDALLLLAGPRALLLQLAHPLVAAAVAEHSAFAERPWRRLAATLHVLFGLYFGNAAEAAAAASRVDRAHARVRGCLRDATETLPLGTPYSAADPELLFWVFATLVDSARAGAEAFVRPLRPEEQERFYRELLRVGGRLDLPAASLPGDVGTFRERMRALQDGPTLTVTPTARRLAEIVLAPPMPGLPATAFAPLAHLTRGLLPPSVRRRYGFAWGADDEARFASQCRRLRTLARLTPAWLRRVPQAHRAQWRARRAGVQSATFAAPRGLR
ncbi:MAG: DUF2236 domain-containing protein [Proteobacteria bacterium]|nr:DUF2236 domain-containing protein [Pseudomonadota bacterium]